MSSRSMSIGFALFSMFFGAGNLVVPMALGSWIQTEDLCGAVFGLFLSGVLVPFLGLFSILVFDGNFRKFFDQMGQKQGFLILLAVELLLGPFGVLPRLVSLMERTINPYLPHMVKPSISNFFICLLTFILASKPQKITRILGTFLTPFLLISLTSLMVFGLYKNPIPLTLSITKIGLKEGLIQGYQTMDLLAAFLFGAAILPDLKNLTEKKDRIFPALLAGTLLFLVYGGLCFLARAHYGKVEGEPAHLLWAIADEHLGFFGAFLASGAVILACLTTAISLTSLFAEYLRKEILRSSLSYTQSLALTLGVTYFFSLLGISVIMNVLSPILTILYPGLIMLSIVHLYCFFLKKDFFAWPIYLVWILTVVKVFCS